METGNCFAAFSVYGYNSDTGECEQFIYGGCGGNENRFDTKEACEAFCAPGGATATGPSGHSTVEPTCGPADGEAYTFKIGLNSNACGESVEEGQPWIRIEIWDESKFPPAAGQTYDLGTASTNIMSTGAVMYYPGSGIPVWLNATSGSITLETWNPFGAIAYGVTGSYNVTLTDGTELQGTFEALWCQIDELMCG